MADIKDKAAKLAKAKAVTFKEALNFLKEERGLNIDNFLEYQSKVRKAESNGDYTAIQVPRKGYTSAPGRGAYQYEMDTDGGSGSAITALNRAKTYAKRNGLTLPDDIINSDGDFSKMSPGSQDMVDLFNMREASSGDIDAINRGEYGNVYVNHHYAGPKDERPKKLEYFNSVTANMKKAESTTTGAPLPKMDPVPKMTPTMPTKMGKGITEAQDFRNKPKLTVKAEDIDRIQKGVKSNQLEVMDKMAPKRSGFLPNKDGSKSTHKMKTETDGKGNWFSFPTVFQNEDGKFVDMSEKAKQKWEPVYEEAKKRGEVIDFGKDKEGALAFGEGSWKPKMEKPKMNLGGMISGSLGKAIQGIGAKGAAAKLAMSANPLGAITTGAQAVGQLVGGIQNGIQELKQRDIKLKKNTNPYGIMKDGGSLEGEGMKNYSGPSHKNGGVPINPDGTIGPNGPEVEGKEKAYNFKQINPGKKYVFPKKMKSLIEAMDKKYKDNNSIDQGTKEMELDKLMKSNEKAKAIRAAKAEAAMMAEQEAQMAAEPMAMGSEPMMEGEQMIEGQEEMGYGGNLKKEMGYGGNPKDEMAKGGYLKNSTTYVNKDGKESKRGLWANVAMKKRREGKLQLGGFPIDFLKDGVNKIITGKAKEDAQKVVGGVGKSGEIINNRTVETLPKLDLTKTVLSSDTEKKEVTLPKTTTSTTSTTSTADEDAKKFKNLANARGLYQAISGLAANSPTKKRFNANATEVERLTDSTMRFDNANENNKLAASTAVQKANLRNMNRGSGSETANLANINVQAQKNLAQIGITKDGIMASRKAQAANVKNQLGAADAAELRRTDLTDDQNKAALINRGTQIFDDKIELEKFLTNRDVSDREFQANLKIMEARYPDSNIKEIFDTFKNKTPKEQKEILLTMNLGGKSSNNPESKK